MANFGKKGFSMVEATKPISQTPRDGNLEAPEAADAAVAQTPRDGTLEAPKPVAQTPRDAPVAQTPRDAPIDQTPRDGTLVAPVAVARAVGPTGPGAGPGLDIDAATVPVIIELVALGLDFPMSPFGKRHVDTPVVKVIVEQGLDGGWGLPKTFFGGEKNLSEAAYDFIMGFSLFRARPLFKQLGAYSLGLLKPDRPDGAVSRVLVCAYLVLGASGVGEKLAWVELEGLPGRARLKVPAGMRLDRYFSQRAGTDQVKAEPLGPALESALVTLGRQVGERAGMREILSMLLPGKFTLGQAKATIETLSGQKINEVSFRRHMSQKTVYTGEELKSKQFRPPKFYRFKD